MSSHHDRVKQGRGSLHRGESSRSTNTSREPIDIPRGRGGQLPRRNLPSDRRRDHEYGRDGDDENDESHHHGGSLSSAPNIPRFNTVNPPSISDQATMRSMFTVVAPPSRSYEQTSRESVSRRNQDPIRAENLVQPGGLLAEFVKLDLSDYESYATFILRNPSILEEQGNSVRAQAIRAYQVNNRELALRYAQLTMILHKCKTKNLDRSCQYVQNLASQDYEGNYHDELGQLMSYIQTQAAASPTTPTAIAHEIHGLSLGDASIAPPLGRNGRNERNDQFISQVPRPDIRQRRLSSQESATQAVYATLHNPSQPRPFSLEGGRQRSQTQGSYARSTINNLPSALSSAFVVEDSSFFVVGRVFRVLWHQPAGHNLQGQVADSTSVGKYEELIYTTARWMLVVKADRGHCICCPISTYRNRGLHGKNYRQPNIKAHAMIYAYGMLKPQDEVLTKHPIHIDTHESGARINPISSVNFSKLHTVEHNVKVANIGMVSGSCRHLIVDYASDEFLARR